MFTQYIIRKLWLTSYPTVGEIFAVDIYYDDWTSCVLLEKMIRKAAKPVTFNRKY